MGMVIVIALFVVLLFAGLGGLFFASARLIRRDMNERFDRIRQGLENEASAIVRHLQ
jgi:hypothetical protein